MEERPSILVVDDDESVLALIRTVLTREGFEVVTCSDPRQALSLASNTRPDAVVLDLMMPEVSGFEILEYLRGDPATSSIPVIILSARDGGADRVRGLKAGADDYLTKPFEPEELSIRLHNLIRRGRDHSSTILAGKLGRLAAGDILQQVLVSGVSGILELDGAPAGRITVSNGVILSARCGKLQGEPALIVLLERREGDFRLAEIPPDTPASMEPLSLNGTLMLLAWLEDELERRRHLLPPPDTPLDAVGTGAPPEGECSQLDPVLHWFREREGASLGQLEEAMIVAPQQARLATALLTESGLLRPRAGSAPEPAAPGDTTGTPSRRRLDAACAHLARRAEELVGGIPDSLLGRPKHHLLSELRRDGSASLRIPCSEATLLLHVHQLSGLAGLRARAFLAMTTAVVLVPATMPNVQTIDMVEAASALDPPPIRLVIPPPDETEENLEFPPSWRLAGRIPPTLEELLELLD